jgi:flagellar hook-associated protein 2
MLATNGSLDGRTQGINNTIKDIGKQRDALNVRLAEIETRYRTQFTALDSMLSSMNQTSTYLTQQLDILQSQTKNL